MGATMSIMGGGNSRPNAAEGAAVPAPAKRFFRRLEELRKGRSVVKVEGTLSKKQLLIKDTEEDDSNSQSSRQGACPVTKTTTETAAKEAQPAKEEIGVKVIIPTEKLSRVVPLPNFESEAVEGKEKDNKHNDRDEQEKVIHLDAKAETDDKAEGGETTEPNTDNEQFVDAKSDVDDDDEDDNDEEFGKFFPGSPSFRIYCIEADNKQEEESKNQIPAGHQKSRSVDSVLSTISEAENSVNLEEVPVAEIEPITKRRRGSKKKFGAVRSLLKVKSCYYPMCSCTGDERRRLIAAKSRN